MMDSTHPGPSGVRVAIVYGFATAIAMWGLGYVLHLPGLQLSPKLSLPLMLALMAGASLCIGRESRSIAVAAGAGAVTSAINLLILGGVLTSDDADRGWVAVWCAGFVATGAVLGAIAGGVGLRLARPQRPHGVDPGLLFALTACVATFLLIIIGGVVTSEEAGLAVPDWPNSFGSNMFLYPLSKMIAQNDVYFEHTHRLFGSMVGLTVLAITVDRWIAGRRRWLAALATFALVLVAFQGLLGGMRVEQADLWTGTVPQWKRSAKELFDSLGLTENRLRVFHGVLGQLFFGLLVAMAAFATRTWARASQAAAHQLRGQDCWLSLAFLLCVVTQLILGAITRHVAREPFVLIHLGFAFVVAGLGFLVAIRRLIAAREIPASRRTAAAIGLTILGQLVLGFAALALTDGEESTAGTLVATAHQATGALILALAVLDFVWTCRLSSVVSARADGEGMDTTAATTSVGSSAH